MILLLLLNISDRRKLPPWPKDEAFPIGALVATIVGGIIFLVAIAACIFCVGKNHIGKIFSFTRKTNIKC